MRMYRICWMPVLLLVITGLQLRAQVAGDTAALFSEMKQLQSVYGAHGLSFDIRYTYASEQAPAAVLDSLNGRMEVSGNNYHYWLDSVEMMVNTQYSVTLFKKNKLMYLAKPSRVSAGDPVQQLRLMLQQGSVSSCAVAGKGTHKKLSIYFAQPSPYRELEMSIDKKTGYVISMRYVMKTAMLLATGAAADVADANARYGEYAIVETTFSNYTSLTANSSRFDESRFFYKEGTELRTTSGYHDYKIFKGSPNL